MVYDKIFHHIISLGVSRHIHFNPQRLTCDFEPAAIQAFAAVFPAASNHACFFHYSQALWAKITDLKLGRLVAHSKKDDIPDERRKSAQYWFNGGIGLALVPPALVESIWIDIMDTYTPDVQGATQFNDYIVDTYVDRSSSLFSTDLWNVHTLIEKRLPRTNNHVEGYNRRMKTVFPVHPHIFEFIRLLQEEHVFQQHLAEESQLQLRKRRKCNDDKDLLIEQLLKQFSDGQISQMDLAIQCGLALKTSYVK
jgi:hypothetical protein